VFNFIFIAERVLNLTSPAS